MNEVEIYLSKKDSNMLLSGFIFDLLIQERMVNISSLVLFSILLPISLIGKDFFLPPFPFSLFVLFLSTVLFVFFWWCWGVWMGGWGAVGRRW